MSLRVTETLLEIPTVHLYMYLQPGIVPVSDVSLSGFEVAYKESSARIYPGTSLLVAHLSWTHLWR